ncbi:hypothetical protein BDR04DRAFT_1228109 [Suillus decipiens]|nr:hypothetical protein BDR04DRAFT_1228109 [Suillus decipiens]
MPNNTIVLASDRFTGERPATLRKYLFGEVMALASLGFLDPAALFLPSNDSALFAASKPLGGAATSPSVVVSNSDLNIGSRTFYGLAVDRKASRMFAKSQPRWDPSTLAHFEHLGPSASSHS